MANDKASIWALLVGINDYKATDDIRTLHGCVNDIEAMRLFLITDLRLPPADLDTDLRTDSITRGVSPSGWAAAQANHVLLAGCRDTEESHEHQAAPGVIYGALTFFTIEYLKQLASGSSYGDLHE